MADLKHRLNILLDNGNAREDMSAEHAAFIRGMQLHTLRSLVPYGLIASTFNASICVAFMAAHAPSSALIMWAGVMALMGLLGLRTSLRASRRATAPRPRSVQALWRPITESTLLGMAWAVCPLLFVPQLQGFDLALIICVCGGMMAGGAYVLSTLPGAAVPFVVSLSFGLAMGILRSDGGVGRFTLLALLVCFTVVMLRTTFWNHRNYIAAWLQQEKLKDQAKQLEKKQGVISLLLNEFEQAASDSLFELDEDHRVVRPSSVLAERTEFRTEQLIGQHVASFFDGTNVEGRPAFQALLAALEVNGEIHNLRLPVRKKGEVTVWWRVSAKPIYNEAGIFEGYRGVASNVTEKYEAERQIYKLAHFDSLTGVPKRERMLKALEEAVNAPHGEAKPFAVHALDLDRFKTINDVYGHSVGDAYLKATAARLQEIIGPNNIVARFGGDEFVILQNDITGRGEAMALAVTIQQALAEPVNVDGSNAQSSVSIGIAVFPEHAGTPAELLKFADLALLASKGAGRDTACFFDTDLNDDVSERVAMEDDLRHALAQNQFRLNFQRIISARTGELRAMETLIRWTHPERGEVGPDTFVPILEQAGMITTVGDWIIREALREAATWDDSIRVSINLSPLQVRNRSLITTVTHALAQSGVNPKRVDFEITETALFDDAEESLSALHALHRLGVTISLDDFGTGFSSLSLLRIFPFDKIKIDKSFVQQMESSEECLAIVRSVVGLARSLGMRTTAEGVETETLADMLRAEGCAELQGYHFSRPMAADALVAAGLLPRRLAAHDNADQPDLLALPEMAALQRAV
ncbi:MAG: EAL domain-containing protein [Alphaproteobacteria bacterium]|nr:EAL domain-containing protein [Alphaproteobacteria bacterium]MBU2084300.1 EAL domain-containing protein [Alphaproteobacteria bacterium]MBU2196159.1 EAL domain-containing protein [Alphaproteobacteria bacterium]